MLSSASTKIGVIQNVTVTVNGAENWNYPVQRTFLDTGTRVAIFEFAQPITYPEELLVTVSIGAASNYFRLNILPGDVDSSGTVDANDETYEQNLLNANPIGETAVMTADTNGDGVANSADVTYIQNQIAAGQTVLPPEVVISGNGTFL